jgi:hypothetical protein
MWYDSGVVYGDYGRRNIVVDIDCVEEKNSDHDMRS